MKTLTMNQRAARRAAAEDRRCPKCKRAAALGARVEVECNGRHMGGYRRCRYCKHEVGAIAGKLFGHHPETERQP